MSTAPAQEKMESSKPSDEFLESYQQLLTDIGVVKKKKDDFDNFHDKANPGEIWRGSCCSAICCGRWCTPAFSAYHEVADCSLPCCFGWTKTLACMGFTFGEKICERTCCRPCCGKLPFENWNMFQYAATSAVAKLGRDIPITNVYGLQLLTRLPYGTGVFRQTGLTVKSVSIKTNKNISGEWIIPPEPAHNGKKIILYLHGGAFVLQDAPAARFYVGLYAKYFGWKIFSANYGHPPQNDYGSIMDGLLDTWVWLRQEGYAPEDIVIAGDSAGGNLAISLSLLVTFRRHEKAAGLLLFSPWVNMYPFSSESYKKNQNYDYIASRRIIQLMVDLYVQDDDPESPLFSLYKLSETELRELPPLYVSCGRAEVLNWSITTFFHKAKKAKETANDKGVPADVLDEAPGMPHVYPMLSCTHPAPDVKFIPCLFKCIPCCVCGHCWTTEETKALEHPTWKTLHGMKAWLETMATGDQSFGA